MGYRDNVNYTLTNRWCATNYAKTPHYVGYSYLEQYPGMKRSLFVISAHIISDVYLGMVRTTQFFPFAVAHCITYQNCVPLRFLQWKVGFFTAIARYRTAIRQV